MKTGSAMVVVGRSVDTLASTIGGKGRENTIRSRPAPSRTSSRIAARGTGHITTSAVIVVRLRVDAHVTAFNVRENTAACGSASSALTGLSTAARMATGPTVTVIGLRIHTKAVTVGIG